MGAAKLRRPEFAVVGFGRFGRLVAAYLRPYGETVVCDSRDVRAEAAALGLDSVSHRSAARARHVILAPPIGQLRDSLRSLAPHLRPRTVVMDTCSVKVETAEILLEEVPPGIDCMATHPLFGPDSAADGLAGHSIVICPLRGGRPRVARRFLEGLGLETLVMTPDEHDRGIAETQALVMWIGRALERIGASPRPLATTGYTRLLEILRYVTGDSHQLFIDIERRNPHAATARRRFLEALLEVEANAMEGMEVVYRASGMAEAEVVKGYLEAEGFPVDLDYESAGPVMGLTMDGLGEVRVCVPPEYAEDARLAIARRPGGTAPFPAA
jgi:prephenate dehydrogenase